MNFHNFLLKSLLPLFKSNNFQKFVKNLLTNSPRFIKSLLLLLIALILLVTSLSTSSCSTSLLHTLSVDSLFLYGTDSKIHTTTEKK